MDVLEAAKAQLATAKTAEQLRQAQAVVLPLEFGLSLAQTAKAIGLSVGWACQLRTRFVREGGCVKSTRGGRRRENLTREEEADFLAPFFEKAKVGGILVVGEIKQALDARLGRTVALASAYNLLHRHGWRKLAPDKRHPQANVAAQEEWKKTSRSPQRNRPAVARHRCHSLDVSRRSALRPDIRYPTLLVPQAGTPTLPGHGHSGIHLRLCRRLGG
jgi:transposase